MCVMCMCGVLVCTVRVMSGMRVCVCVGVCVLFFLCVCVCVLVCVKV